MSRHPLVVRGRTFQNGELVPVDVGVDPESGRITGVARGLQGDSVDDHGDGILVPGAIDVHVHLRDPGDPQKEDFASGTRAALAGGVTTLFDMPNTRPPVTALQVYREKEKIAASKALTDWGLWGGTTGVLEETLPLSRVAPGIKVFLGESTGGVMLDHAEGLAGLMKALAEDGFSGVVAFHAEAQSVLQEAGARHQEVPGLKGHEARRPVEAELEAFSWIKAATSRASRNGGLPFKVHVAHVSTPELLEAALAERIGCGVTPHHILLHHDLPLGAFGRVNPPLRSPARMEGLFAGFAAGRIPILESDHAPHTREEKEVPVEQAPSGLPGVETLVPVMFALALKPPAGGPSISPEQVIRSTTEAPAALFALNKGRLAPGLDADIAVYHKSDIAPLVPENRVTRCGWSPYEGRPAVFARTVYLGGRLVVEDSLVVAKEGSGRQVVPGRQVLDSGQ